MHKKHGLVGSYALAPARDRRLLEVDDLSRRMGRFLRAQSLITSEFVRRELCPLADETMPNGVDSLSPEEHAELARYAVFRDTYFAERRAVMARPMVSTTAIPTVIPTPGTMPGTMARPNRSFAEESSTRDDVVGFIGNACWRDCQDNGALMGPISWQTGHGEIDGVHPWIHQLYERGIDRVAPSVLVADGNEGELDRIDASGAWSVQALQVVEATHAGPISMVWRIAIGDEMSPHVFGVGLYNHEAIAHAIARIGMLGSDVIELLGRIRGAPASVDACRVALLTVEEHAQRFTNHVQIVEIDRALVRLFRQAKAESGARVYVPLYTGWWDHEQHQIAVPGHFQATLDSW